MKPTKANMQRLYSAADAFRKMAPWEWTDDDRIFGVIDPKTGETGYCSVLGALGEVYALVVYEGEEGLSCVFKLLDPEPNQHEPDEDFMYSQKALMASFENRQDLQAEDLKPIRSLGLTYRGRKVWPQFRHFLPGHPPWFLNNDQTDFLATAMEQALDVLPRSRNNPRLLPDIDEDHILVRTPLKDENGQIHWKDEVHPVVKPAPRPEPRPEVHLNEIGLERLKKKAGRTHDAWEIGCNFSPIPVQDKAGDRPYFPQLMMIMDKTTGMILSAAIEQKEGHEQILLDQLLNTMLDQSVVPQRFIVADEKIAALVKPVAAALKITLDRVETLPLFREARRLMREHMR